MSIVGEPEEDSIARGLERVLAFAERLALLGVSDTGDPAKQIREFVDEIDDSDLTGIRAGVYQVVLAAEVFADSAQRLGELSGDRSAIPRSASVVISQTIEVINALVGARSVQEPNDVVALIKSVVRDYNFAAEWEQVGQIIDFIQGCCGLILHDLQNRLFIAGIQQGLGRN